MSLAHIEKIILFVTMRFCLMNNWKKKKKETKIRITVGHTRLSDCFFPIIIIMYIYIV